jgi:hypothetical protein
MLGNAPTTLVIISWNGQGQPLTHITRDVEPQFDLVVFDYSGQSRQTSELMSAACLGKGEVIKHIYATVRQRSLTPDYISIIDHDIELTVSQINDLIRIGQQAGLDSFSPALTLDSYFSFAEFRVREGTAWRPVPFVEIMMPVYRFDLFEYCARYFSGTITSYGLDEFAIPVAQQVLALEATGIIDAVAARHLNPVESHRRSYPNGLSAFQERALVRNLAMNRLALERPDLVGTAWYFDTFARWNGPLRFLPLRLLQPFMWLKRKIARPVR